MNAARKAFGNIHIIPDWVNGHFIQWELDPFFRATRPYNFELESAETSDFSDVVFSKKNLGDVFFTVDDSKTKQSWALNHFYRVILNTGDGGRFSSSPILFGASRHEQRKYAMAADIVRKEILMCRYAGTEGWLLRRKSYGTVGRNTSANIDPVSGVPIADTKEQDYGVGIDAGYYAPVPCVFFIEAGSQDKQLDVNGIGVKENYTSNIRAPGYPIFEVRDVICEAKDGYRYSIGSRNAKQFPGTNIIIMQKASINLIPPSDTIYSIPTPLALP
jgi:hypothetical protein